MDFVAPFCKCGLAPIAEVTAANPALPSRPEVTNSPDASSVTGTMTKLSDPPFRFLDLPKEIRLTVYEFLPTKTTHHKMLQTDFKSFRPNYASYITLVVKSLEGVAILRTCQLIHSEATAIFRPALKSIREDPMRIIADGLSIDSGMLYNIFRLLMTNNGYKIWKIRHSPSFKNPAVRNFLRAARAKGGLPQVHVALETKGELDEYSKGRDHILGLESVLGSGFVDPVLCIVYQRWKRFSPNEKPKGWGFGNVAYGVPDSRIPECKWIVQRKLDMDLDEWGRVWAEGVGLSTSKAPPNFPRNNSSLWNNMFRSA